MNTRLIDTSAKPSDRVGRVAGRLVFAALAVLVTEGPVHGEDVPKDKEKAGAGKLLVATVDFVPSLFLGDPETGAWEKVGDPGLAGRVFSCDGHALAAVAHPSAGATDSGIWVYDLAGKTPRRRAFDRPGAPSWSNDGTQIVIGTKADRGKYETFRVKADGTGLTQLHVADSEFVTDCSRDGRWLFSWNPRTRNLQRHVNLVHQDGTGSHELVNEPGLAVFRLSPDGRELAYAIIFANPGATTSSLWVVDIDGANRRQISIKLDVGAMIRPVWSPEGLRLALGVTWNGPVKKRWVDQIMLIDLEGKTLRILPGPSQRFSLQDWK